MSLETLTREDLRPLLELQRIDSAVDRLTHRRANLPEQQELDDRTAQRDDTRSALTEKQTELDRVVREQTRLEDEIGRIDEKVDHEQKRLYSGEIGNPRELSNIQAELDALRRRKSHLEDQELEQMEMREGLEGETAALERALAEIEAGVAEAAARRDAATVEIDRELGEFGARRAEVAPGIDTELIGLYEDLRRKYQGVAIGALEGNTCRACSLPLSPAALDEIKHSDDPLVRCENCRRLLVVT